MVPLPPPPQGLPAPPRSVRALRIGFLLGTAAVLASGVAFIAWYSLHSLGEQHATAAAEQAQPAGQGVGMHDMLATAPTGTEIAAFRKKQPPAPPQTSPEPAPTQAEQKQQTQTPAPIDPNMTDAAVAARKAAWAVYYQQLAETQKARYDRIKAGMTSDTDPTQQQQQVAAGLPPGVTGQQKANPTDFFSSVASNPATDYSPFTLTDPISPYEVKAGTVITGKLYSGLNSDSPGEVVAVVSKPVDDYATGNHILIPQGSRLIGTYSTAVAYGQTRVMVAWTRIIYPGPCSQSLDLGAMPGTDQTGQAGFADITEDHLGKIFLNALLVSVFGASVQLSQPPQSSFQQYNPVQTAGGAIGQQMASLGAEFARKGLNIPPTQRIRQGYNFAILTTKDIAFAAPWQEGVCTPMSIQSSPQQLIQPSPTTDLVASQR